MNTAKKVGADDFIGATGADVDGLPRLTPVPACPPIRRGTEVVRETPPEAIVEGLAWARLIGVLVAESGAGKSFVLLDLAADVATGTPWHGRRVRRGSVLYLAYESDALGLRLQGIAARGVDLTHLHFLAIPAPLSPRIERDGSESPSLGEVFAQRALAALTDQIAVEAAPPLRLMIIDTVRASLVGSEDSSEAVSAYLRAVRRLLVPYPALGTLLAHHAGWQDGEQKRKRERGSSAFRGNVDGTFYLEVVAENRELGTADLRLTALKVRDDVKGPPLALRRSRVTLATVDTDGRPYTTCVIESDPRTRADREAEVLVAHQAAEAALNARALDLIRQHPITSMTMLRALLGVRYEVAVAVVTRLAASGRIKPPKQRQAYEAL